MKKNRLIRQFTSAFLLTVFSLTSVANGVSDGEKRQRIELMKQDDHRDDDRKRDC